jgi:heterotetrameric sarcosine oxidase gamma subunit
MLERTSPLAEGASAPGLSLHACGRLVQYHAWPETYTEMAGMVARYCGVTAGPAPSKAVQGAAGSLLRIHPQRLWLLSERSDAGVGPALESHVGVSLDLTHARSIIRVAEESAEALLSRFVAIDLRAHRFAVDDLAITPLHRVSVVLWRRPTGIDILVPRSFARSTWDLLAETAERLR